MWPKAVVPRAVERQLPFECLERIWDNAQTSSAFAFDSSNPTLNHRQAPILPQSSESMPNSMATAPPSESVRDELFAVVRDEVVVNWSTETMWAILACSGNSEMEGRRRNSRRTVISRRAEGVVVHRNHVGHFGGFRTSEMRLGTANWRRSTVPGATDRFVAPITLRLLAKRTDGWVALIEGSSSRVFLRRPLERDDREMSPLAVEMNRQFEPHSGPTSKESPRGSTRGSPRPSTAGLKAGCPNGRAASVVNLIRGSAS